MLRIEAPTISDPSVTKVALVEDLGEVVPLLDAEGMRHTGYTTKFVIDGVEAFTQISHEAVAQSGLDVETVRTEADTAFLRDNDIDVTAWSRVKPVSP